MITRRHILKSLVLTTGAFALSRTPIFAQKPAAAPADGVFKLPPLGYGYDALEPFIDTETMKIHHDKHHAAYVAKLNTAIAGAPGLEKKPIEEILTNLDAVPEAVRKDIRNQGGGHANHSLFWQTLKKNENGKPIGELAKAIDTSFGSFGQFQDTFGTAATKVFGSGWAWLVWKDKKLTVDSSANQDSPYSTGGVPLLGIDVWEHAYYLKYQNRRPEYIKAFQSVINWDFVSERFSKAAKA
ncbi:MAG: superoxide dismutase [Chthoniobacter sp.]|nr:superoxide dismutase [Chthoniobacter sp.]